MGDAKRRRQTLGDRYGQGATNQSTQWEIAAEYDRAWVERFSTSLRSGPAWQSFSTRDRQTIETANRAFLVRNQTQQVVVFPCVRPDLAGAELNSLLVQLTEANTQPHRQITPKEHRQITRLVWSV